MVAPKTLLIVVLLLIGCRRPVSEEVQRPERDCDRRVVENPCEPWTQCDFFPCRLQGDTCSEDCDCCEGLLCDDIGICVLVLG